MFTLILAFVLSVYFYSDNAFQLIEWSTIVTLMILWFLIGYQIKLYSISLQNKFSLRIVNFLKAYFTMVMVVFIFYSIYPFPVPHKNVVIASVLSFPVLGVPVNLLLLGIVGLVKKSKEDVKYTLVAGVGKTAYNVERLVYNHKSKGYKVKGFIKCKKEECVVGQDRVVGSLDNIHDYLKENPVDEIVIAIPVKPSKKIKNIIKAADYHGIRVKYIPDYQDLFGANYKATRVGRIDAINVRQLPLDESFSFFLKNAFDKVFAGCALFFLMPVFLIIGLLIKLDSPGPVFYCPVRIGRGGKPFKVYKFRSMRVNDAINGGVLSTQKDDPRVTKIGRILRKYSLDELPQFINVLLGEMSVVGPRPHRGYLNQQLQASVDKYMVRHYFKPGITGWAQVNGWRGPTETDEQKIQRTLHDLWYMENWSFWLDIKIVYMTIFDKKVHKSAF